MTESTGFKYCRSCDSTKVITDFYVCSANKDGRYTYCSACCKKRRDEVGYNKYSWNPAAARERQRQFRKGDNKFEKSYRPRYLKTIPGKASKLLASAVARAKKKEFECDLDREWVLEKLEAGVCEASGIKFNYIVPEGRTRAWNAPSIDRKDNTKGYTKDNCWVVCVLYNVGKGESTVEEVLNMARGIVAMADRTND